jgi:hypothetical protein
MFYCWIIQIFFLLPTRAKNNSIILVLVEESNIMVSIIETNTTTTDNIIFIMDGDYHTVGNERVATIISFLFWSIVQTLFIVYSIYKCSYEIDRTQQQKLQEEQQVINHNHNKDHRPQLEYTWCGSSSSSSLSSQPTTSLSLLQTSSFLFDEQASSEYIQHQLIQLFLCRRSC